MREIIGVHPAPAGHWVGDGFPVQSLLSHHAMGAAISPFIMLDYASPHHFAPATTRRGVGAHPHKGFETVTIVYSGEVEHRDSTGAGGIIGPGDVQWMTAGAGIVHQEFHSDAYTRAGGPFEIAQLWVNLPAKDKSAPAGYQTILNADIPVVDLGAAGRLRVIAGSFDGAKGPARTFTPINIWDVRFASAGAVTLEPPEGHTVQILVLAGGVAIDGGAPVTAIHTVTLGTTGGPVRIAAEAQTKLLVLTGAPIDEPVAAYGPFVMNTEAEIRQAIADFRAGRFGEIA